jgi:hypothetical protein
MLPTRSIPARDRRDAELSQEIRRVFVAALGGSSAGPLLPSMMARPFALLHES